MSRDAYATQRKHLSVLDAREDGERMIVAVESAEKSIEILRYEGVDFRVVDLNLDEIFEAYVAGRKDNPPTSAKPQAAVGAAT
jgi:hypothetical protein